MYDRYLVLYVHTYARDDFRPKWKTSSRDESLVANCHAIAVVAVDGVTMHAVEMQPSLQESNYLFPYNPSLEDEIKRLFDISRQESQPKVEDVMEEFRHNGRDYEYCPDLDTDTASQSTSRRKKNKKPLPTECVFCRNNGEKETYYRKHLLKDPEGRVECPVLRAYTCPICGATGDNAHTVKYCSKGPYNSNSITTASAFKFLRNSMGKRRGRKEQTSPEYMRSDDKGCTISTSKWREHNSV